MEQPANYLGMQGKNCMVLKGLSNESNDTGHNCRQCEKQHKTEYGTQSRHTHDEVAHIQLGHRRQTQ